MKNFEGHKKKIICIANIDVINIKQMIISEWHLCVIGTYLT